MILAICAVYLKQRGLLKQMKVVTTVMSNLGLERCLGKHGIGVERVQVGDRYVLDRMRQSGCQLGGEQSGHIIFADLSTSGDGIVTALISIAAMRHGQKPLSKLNSDFVKFPQKLINVSVRDKTPLASIDPIRRIIESKEQELGDKGRILVRYSGTENKVRIMVECEDEERCKRHAAEVAQVIEKNLGCP